MKKNFCLFLLINLFLLNFTSAQLLKDTDSKHRETQKLQAFLNALGFGAGKVDGIHGNKTTNALITFQKQYNINPTGKLDAQTKNLINEIQGSRVSDIQPLSYNINDKGFLRSDMKPADYTGQGKGNLDNLPKYKKLSDNWIKTKASGYGPGIYGDKEDKYQGGCGVAMNNRIVNGKRVVKNLCDPNVVAVALPPEVLRYYYGENPSPKLYDKIAGSPIEIINLENGTCVVMPLYNWGPKPMLANGKLTNGGIDLTKRILDKLNGNVGSLTHVMYRPVPKGNVGCENSKRLYAENAVNKKIQTAKLLIN